MKDRPRRDPASDTSAKTTEASKAQALTEDEIRPDDLMAGQAERFAEDIRRLLEHADEFVDVPCPACGSDSKEPAFTKYDIEFVRCADCETMYVSPRPTPALLETYYATSLNYQYWNEYIFPASEEARREKIFRPRALRVADICRRHEVATDVLLEVGAGFGTFCEEIDKIGLFDRVVAVEPTPDLAKTCRAKGLEVIEKPIEQVRSDEGSVNVVASFEVIEHLFAPEQFLRDCAAALAPGGLLIITCPNVKGFDIQTLGALSGSVDPEHLNYFHPASLSGLVERCGLKVLEVLTPGRLDAELVRKKALSGQLDLRNQPFLTRVLIDEWGRLGRPFQEFLAENLLSSHMWLVAVKPAEPGESSNLPRDRHEER